MGAKRTSNTFDFGCVVYICTVWDMHKPHSSEFTQKDKALNEAEKWRFVRISTRIAFIKQSLKAEKLDEMSVRGLGTKFPVSTVIL